LASQTREKCEAFNRKDHKKASEMSKFERNFSLLQQIICAGLIRRHLRNGNPTLGRLDLLWFEGGLI